jgi:hypothetical protein
MNHVGNVALNEVIGNNVKCVILSVLFGYETWSLTLREGHRLREYENRMLSRIQRTKR